MRFRREKRLNFSLNGYNITMISETTARVIRNLIIQAADARNIPVEIFYESGLNLYIFFDKPEQQEENHGKN